LELCPLPTKQPPNPPTPTPKGYFLERLYSFGFILLLAFEDLYIFNPDSVIHFSYPSASHLGRLDLFLADYSFISAFP